MLRLRGQKMGHRLSSLTFPPVLGYPKPLASAPFHSPSSIPSSRPLRQGLTLSPHTTGSIYLIPPPLCSQHPTTTLAAHFRPNWVPPFPISQP